MRELEIKDPRAMAAGETWENAGTGTLFKLISSTSAVDVELWQRGNRIARAKGITQGMGVRVRDPDSGKLVPFDKATVYSAAAQNIVVATGDGEVETDALTGIVTASIIKARTLDSLPDDSIAGTTAEKIVTDDGLIREVIVTNLSTNTALKRVGDAGVGAANGTPLQPGESVTLTVSADVWVYNAAAGAESVAVTLIKD